MNKAFEKILERLEEIKGCACDGIDCRECEYTSDCLEGEMSEKVAIDMAKGIVQEVSEEYNGGWIPCSERLPENNKEVLCYAKSIARGGDVMFTGSQNNGCWFLQTAADTMSYPSQYKVIAWQPLPEPYKERDE